MKTSNRQRLSSAINVPSFAAVSMSTSSASAVFERAGHRITGNSTGQHKSRGIGWEYVHFCIDDASRIAFTYIFPDEKAVSAVAFLKAALAYFRSLGITVSRVMTDNGPCDRASHFAEACRALGLKHSSFFSLAFSSICSFHTARFYYFHKSLLLAGNSLWQVGIYL
jgi:transposase InsO family protein